MGCLGERVEYETASGTGPAVEVWQQQCQYSPTQADWTSSSSSKYGISKMIRGGVDVANENEYGTAC